jgi:DNA-directed RNA polymerase beta subunit
VSDPTPLTFNPHLESYARFLQLNVPPRERPDEGLQRVFRTFFPVKTLDGTVELFFREYSLESPRYGADECLRRGMVFAAPIKVTIELIVYERVDGSELQIRDIKQQEVYWGELPLMTERGTFIVDGVERAPVARVCRVPGVRHVTAADGSPAVEILPRHGLPLSLSIDRYGAWNAAWGDDLTFPGERLFRAYGFHPENNEPCDPSHDQVELYAITHGGERVEVERAAQWFAHAFHLGERFEPGRVGRLMTNVALGLDVQFDQWALDTRDLLAVAEVLRADRLLRELDCEHQVRFAGDFAEDHVWQGMCDFVTKVRERLERAHARGDVDTLMPHDLCDARQFMKSVAAMLRKSPDLEDLDRTNPLARVAHPLRARVDPDAAGALTEATLAPWLRTDPARPGFVNLASGASWTEYGLVEVDAPGDKRPLTERLVPASERGEASAHEGMLRALVLESPEPPREASGFERAVAEASGAVLIAREAGRARVVSERHVWVIADDATRDEPTLYRLRPRAAPRLATPLSFRPVLREGARVERGDVLAESGAVVNGALALGRNVTVAHAADLAPGHCRVSSRAAQGFRAAEIVRVEAVVRDTRLGVQRFSRVIPWADAHAVRHLDATGLAELGAEVEPGDILAGCLSPTTFAGMSEADPAGGDEGPVEDASVRSSVRGRVVSVEIFERRGRERTPRHEAIVGAMREALDAEMDARAVCLAEMRGSAKEEVLSEIRYTYEEARWSLDRGDDLPPGVVAMAVFEVLVLRDLAPGDTLARRNGARWTVDAIVDEGAKSADVEVSDANMSGEVYLLRLAPEVTPEVSKPAKKRAKKSK